MGKVYDRMRGLTGAKGNGTKGDVLEAIMALGHELKHTTDQDTVHFLTPVAPVVVYVENMIRGFVCDQTANTRPSPHG